MKPISQNQAIYNVTFIGDSFVGKTQIVNSFIGNPFSEMYDATIGASMIKIESKRESPNDDIVPLYIWDTGGQERYKSLGPIYYHNSNAAVIVYDVSIPQSFNNVSSWYSLYKENTPENNEIFLVGNKIDLRTNNSDFVSNKEGEDLASTLNCKFLETSAKTSENIKELFDLLVNSAISNSKPDDSPSVALKAEKSNEKSCC